MGKRAEQLGRENQLCIGEALRRMRLVVRRTASGRNGRYFDCILNNTFRGLRDLLVRIVYEGNDCGIFICALPTTNTSMVNLIENGFTLSFAVGPLWFRRSIGSEKTVVQLNKEPNRDVKVKLLKTLLETSYPFSQ